jgi:hypothetical protein
LLGDFENFLPNVSQSPAPIVYSDSVSELGRKEIVDRLFILDQFRSIGLVLGHLIAPSSDDSTESFAAKCVKVGDWNEAILLSGNCSCQSVRDVAGTGGVWCKHPSLFRSSSSAEIRRSVAPRTIGGIAVAARRIKSRSRTSPGPYGDHQTRSAGKAWCRCQPFDVR